MKEVTKEEFDKFLENKDYISRLGEWMHSEYLIDINTGEEIAYNESSSWGAPTIYKIKQ